MVTLWIGWVGGDGVATITNRHCNITIAFRTCLGGRFASLTSFIEWQQWKSLQMADTRHHALAMLISACHFTDSIFYCTNSQISLVFITFPANLIVYVIICLLNNAMDPHSGRPTLFKLHSIFPVYFTSIF